MKQRSEAWVEGWNRTIDLACRWFLVGLCVGIALTVYIRG